MPLCCALEWMPHDLQRHTSSLNKTETTPKREIHDAHTTDPHTANPQTFALIYFNILAAPIYHLSHYGIGARESKHKNASNQKIRRILQFVGDLECESDLMCVHPV